MNIYNSSIPNYSKLYYNINKFNSFDKISENNLYEMLEKIDRFKKYNSIIGYHGYNNVINYLTNPCNYTRFDFDDKILFLILCCDPQLVHFYTFINTTIISRDEIMEIEFYDEIEQAEAARKIQFHKLEENIKYQLGFYDYNLIGLEFSFFRKFYSDKVLIENIKLDMMRVIHDSCANHWMLPEISDAEVAYILDVSDKYIRNIGENKMKVYGNTVAFNTFYQGEIFGLFSSIQKLFFFISTIDRKCKVVSVLEKSSLKDEIREIEKLIGFYDDKFIEAEKTYKKIMDRY